MERQIGLSVCILGLGNVGQHLASIFQDRNIPVRAFYNRTSISPTSISASAPLYNDIGKLTTEADIYILAVSDDAVRRVAELLPNTVKEKKIIAHTSGIHTLDIFPSEIKHPGVFYPLNTFSNQQSINWESTPFYISGDTNTSKNLRKLAHLISERVYTISDKQKSILHVAAVIANNFPNHLFAQADALLKENDLDFSHLLPLINTMVRNLDEKSAASSQTGPAIRGDEQTISKHLELLKNKPELHEIYKTLSKSINKKLDI